MRRLCREKGRPQLGTLVGRQCRTQLCPIEPSIPDPSQLSLTLRRPSGRARTLLSELYDAAVAGAAPGPVTAAALRDFPARPGQRIWLHAMGKAAYPMAASAATTLQRSLLNVAGGLVVGTELQPAPFATLTALNGDHPLPGRHSFTASGKLEEATRGMRGDDIAIVLLSGGVSSMIAAPLRGMAESDLGQLFELLLASGLDIHDMNRMRKRFLRWGAGRLALALAPARTYAFVMSDVPGDDPADIGSGPCSPDPTTVKDLVALLQKTGLHNRIAPAMREHLASVARGVVPETPKRTHPAFAHVTTRVIGSNALALDAIAKQAQSLDLRVERETTSLTGEASACGQQIAEQLLARAGTNGRLCMIWGGETTVQLSGRGGSLGNEQPPSGGRCQELALAASRRLAQAGEDGMRITLLAAGTDGRDGTTDAAGAYADATVWNAILAAGRDPEQALHRHESHAVLGAAGALLPRRDTGTNVMDVVIGVID
jgi:glycerate 2-kinase